MSEGETKVLELLAAAWNEFVKLDYRHPSHQMEFATAIHDAQKIIMWRKAQDNYPEIFPKYEKVEDEF